MKALKSARAGSSPFKVKKVSGRKKRKLSAEARARNSPGCKGAPGNEESCCEETKQEYFRINRTGVSARKRDEFRQAADKLWEWLC